MTNVESIWFYRNQAVHIWCAENVWTVGTYADGNWIAFTGEINWALDGVQNLIDAMLASYVH